MTEPRPVLNDSVIRATEKATNALSRGLPDNARLYADLLDRAGFSDAARSIRKRATAAKE